MLGWARLVWAELGWLAGWLVLAKFRREWPPEGVKNARERNKKKIAGADTRLPCRHLKNKHPHTDRQGGEKNRAEPLNGERNNNSVVQLIANNARREEKRTIREIEWGTPSRQFFFPHR